MNVFVCQKYDLEFEGLVSKASRQGFEVLTDKVNSLLGDSDGRATGADVSLLKERMGRAETNISLKAEKDGFVDLSQRLHNCELAVQDKYSGAAGSSLEQHVESMAESLRKQSAAARNPQQVRKMIMS